MYWKLSMIFETNSLPEKKAIDWNIAVEMEQVEWRKKNSNIEQCEN